MLNFSDIQPIRDDTPSIKVVGVGGGGGTGLDETAAAVLLEAFVVKAFAISEHDGAGILTTLVDDSFIGEGDGHGLAVGASDASDGLSLIGVDVDGALEEFLHDHQLNIVGPYVAGLDFLGIRCGAVPSPVLLGESVKEPVLVGEEGLGNLVTEEIS